MENWTSTYLHAFHVPFLNRKLSYNFSVVEMHVGAPPGHENDQQHNGQLKLHYPQ